MSDVVTAAHVADNVSRIRERTTLAAGDAHC